MLEADVLQLLAYFFGAFCLGWVTGYTWHIYREFWNRLT